MRGVPASARRHSNSEALRPRREIAGAYDTQREAQEQLLVDFFFS